MTEPVFSTHVASLVRKLFRRTAPAPVMEAQAGARTPYPAPDTRWQTQPVIASRLHMIGLSKVRSALGDKWPALAERVMKIAQGIIEKHILPGDIFEPHGDEAFLVLFPQLSPGDAKFKSDAISHEVEKKLIAENFAEVSACIAEVHVLGTAESFLTPQLVTTDVIEDYQSDEKAPPAASPLRRKSDSGEKLSDIVQAGPAVLDRGFPIGKGEEPPPKSSATPLRRSSDREGLSDPSAVKAANNKSTTALPQGDRLARRHTDMEWIYRPVWDFKQGTLITFALYPKRAYATEAADVAAAESMLECNTAGVWKCVNDLTVLSSAGRRLPVLTQIHYATIDNARRRAFLSGTIRNIPAEFRKLISFEIVGCPHGGLNFGICSFMGGLRNGGVRVSLRIDARWPDFIAIERAGAQFVTMDSMDDSAMEKDRMISFEIFAARAANAKLDSGIWGLGTRSLVVAAASAGIRYLSGGAVAPEVANLPHAIRFSPVDLYPH